MRKKPWPNNWFWCVYKCNINVSENRALSSPGFSKPGSLTASAPITISFSGFGISVCFPMNERTWSESCQKMEADLLQSKRLYSQKMNLNASFLSARLNFEVSIHWTAGTSKLCSMSDHFTISRTITLITFFVARSLRICLIQCIFGSIVVLINIDGSDYKGGRTRFE